MKQEVKKYGAVLLLCLAGWGVQAQEAYLDQPYNPGIAEKLEQPRLECIYEFVSADTILAQTRVDYAILQVGQEWTKYGSYERYWADSVCWRSNWKLTVREFRQLRPPVRSTTWDTYYGRLDDHNFQIQGMVGLDFYVYRDSTAQFRWALSADTATVCGYPCRKATAHFRGRDWTAWYTEELPVDAGPWKFNGLPGLILRAETPDGLQQFEAQTVRRGGDLAILREAPIDRAQRISRTDYLRLERYAALNNAEYMSSRIQLVASSGGSGFPKRTFYQPLELE